jgi:hypothetical protein
MKLKGENMNGEILKKGTELSGLILITKKALEEIKKFVPEDRKEQAYHDDKLYWLNISEHKDGSGIRADLCRYYGNTRLINVIKNELELQVKELEDEFLKL